MANPVLHAHGLGIRPSGGGARALLNSLEISLYEHERVALMGPSGSGKSSIVHTLAGITEPTTGTIQILGRTIDHDNHSGRSYQSQFDGLNLAFLHQRTENSIFPWVGVWEHVALGCELRSIERDEALIHHLIAAAGLSDRLEYLPKRLSGGMRRRLALITVLATRSQLFLLDEPFSGSDYDICLDLYETIHNTFQEGTFLFTTHDMDEAALLAHRVLCLDVRVASACMIHEIVCPQSLYNQSPQARRNSFAEFAQSIRSVLDTIRPPRPATTAQPERTLLGEGCELMPH